MPIQEIEVNLVYAYAYSRLSLNGHLYKTDTSVKRTLAFLYSLYLTLYKTDISLRRTLSAGPKGVRLRESCLYHVCILKTT